MMRWEELNRDGFADAVKECEQVCLLPISAIEPHGPHLPVGTDMYQGREVCRRAAEIEPAIIFPITSSGKSTKRDMCLAPSLSAAS